MIQVQRHCGYSNQFISSVPYFVGQLLTMCCGGAIKNVGGAIGGSYGGGSSSDPSSKPKDNSNKKL